MNSSFIQFNYNLTIINLLGSTSQCLQLTPETAIINPDAELVFSIKYNAVNPHQSIEHNLVIEVSGKLLILNLQFLIF